MGRVTRRTKNKTPDAENLAPDNYVACPKQKVTNLTTSPLVQKPILGDRTNVNNFAPTPSASSITSEQKGKFSTKKVAVSKALPAPSNRRKLSGTNNAEIKSKSAPPIKAVNRNLKPPVKSNKKMITIEELSGESDGGSSDEMVVVNKFYSSVQPTINHSNESIIEPLSVLNSNSGCHSKIKENVPSDTSQTPLKTTIDTEKTPCRRKTNSSRNKSFENKENSSKTVPQKIKPLQKIPESPTFQELISKPLSCSKYNETPKPVNKVVKKPKEKKGSPKPLLHLAHLPVYKTVQPSPAKPNKKEDLYEFEADENEPPAKKTKRKPILKIKKIRTYKKKRKVLPLLSPLILSPSTQVSRQPDHPLDKKVLVDNPVDKELSDIHSNISKNLFPDQELGDPVSPREGSLYSPPPYESPQRLDDSQDVPIIRSSKSHNSNDCVNSLEANDVCERSLNNSAYNSSMKSPYSVNFSTPMHLGSSTPMYRNHWTEQSDASLAVNASMVNNFDVSNCFGFDEEEPVKRPYHLSPIKPYNTPGRTPNRTTPGKTPILYGKRPRKPSPVRLPHKQVVRILRFGAEPGNSQAEVLDNTDNPFEMEDVIPLNLFHVGDTHAFSSAISPPPPEDIVKVLKKDKRKKKVVFAENNCDNDSTTISSTDKSSQESNEPKSKKKETKTKASSTKDIKLPEKTHEHNTRSRKKDASVVEETDTDDKDVGYETELSPLEECEEISVIKKSRRSYDRPEYMRTKKYDKYGLGLLDVEETLEHDDNEKEVTTTEANVSHVRPKKKQGQTKKEELELEMWAKAFNEQCMQVESFNLVVE